MTRRRPMPLVEETIVRDADKVVRTTERKLYTLAELKTLDETGSDEIDSDAYEKALDKMREWVDNDSWWTESVLDNDAVELFKACGITVPQKTEVVHVKVDGKFQWDEHNKAITKTVTRDDTI